MRTTATGVAVLAAVSVVWAGAAHAAPSPTAIADIAACAAHRDVPVLLVHGTNADVEQSLGPVRDALLADGRCVYGMEYDSMQPVSVSVDYFTRAAERILAVNGVDSLDLVGKSQGGLIARAVSLKLAAGAAGSARQVVSIFGPQHGVRTVVAGVDTTGSAAVLPLVIPDRPALTDMMAGSPFLQELDKDGMTADGVRYTMIATREDQIVTPYTSAFINAPNVTNILVQDGCPEDRTGHIAGSTDPRTVDLALNALDPQQHPRIRCVSNNDRK
ncbi:triacylglycerol esterase/lipase EstA (alpha/beta hydrolase family) [Nocardia tenerifensis]|uniref:Triacylglycerol esterase/lipase EstA (Alpha/beta hydrolase family) n=1 Tax=Nocardia tenerifensis TaxID=228006 RepID=A0A318JUB5_9NOCA|nr:hypothetical protein [Nocardia tenerifensis]PXX54937.1 triacylglycerol esterase/lipase EstA (alpha/beta hydrolase family) [Nocardia tenerifensis]